MPRPKLKKPGLDLGAVFAEERRQQALREERQADLAAAAPALNLTPGWSLDDAYLLEAVLNELALRESEALACYRPVPGAADFHACIAGEVGLVGSNRAGKSVAAGVEVSMAATGQHPTPGKYPEKALEIAIVGPGEKHLRLVYRILFRPGQFKLLQDPDGTWHVPSYENPDDVAREREWMDAPPLIPTRLVESESWIDKKAEEPALVRLVNGTTLYFFSFDSIPPQGVVYDLCLSGWSEIFDPVHDGYRRVDEIDGPFHVLSYNERLGIIERKRAGKPFVKGYGEICRVTLSNGEVIHTTRHHQVYTQDGRWVSVGDAFEQRLPLRSQPISSGYHARRGGEGPLPTTCDRPERSPRYSSANTDLSIPRQSLRATLSQTTRQDCEGVCVKTSPVATPGCLDDYSACPHPCDERSRQVQGGDREPSPLQDDARGRTQQNCSADGLASSRVGSLTCRERKASQAFSSCAHAGRGASGSSSLATRARLESVSRQAQFQSPVSSSFDPDTSNEPIADRGSSASASELQNEEHDRLVHILSIEHDCHSEIWDISVEDNHNYFYGGVLNHNCWFDEEHPRARVWLTEMRARRMSVRGRFLWSATPENATPTFYALKSRADRPDMASKPPIAQVRFFELYSKDNPYLPPDAREAFFETLREEDPDAAVAKVEGDWAFRKYIVYPEFNENLHLIEPFPIDHRDTLYAVIDPSITRCAIILAAVMAPDSPYYLPQWPDRLVVTDEAVIENCTAAKAARALRRLLNERKHWVEKVIFDFRHGRKREDDGGMIAEKYWKALKEEDVRPRIDRIVWGSDNFADGVDAVKEFLAPRGNLPPRIVGFKTLRWWTWEFHRYHRRKNPDGTPGKIHRKKDDLMDCTRYLVQANPQWVTPPGLDDRSARAFSAEELRQFDRDPVNSLYGHLYRRSVP